MKEEVRKRGSDACNATGNGQAGPAHGVGEWARKSVNIQDGWSREMTSIT
jgi:hypothetical protein